MRRSRQNDSRIRSDSDNGDSSRGEHDYGRGHTAERAFGSRAGHIVRGPGPVDGAGEVVAGTPGRAAGRFNGTASDQGGQPAASGATPRELEDHDSSEEE